MRLYFNHLAKVRVHGVLHGESFSRVYDYVVLIEEVSAKDIEKECGEKSEVCIRLQFNTGDSVAFAKETILFYEIL